MNKFLRSATTLLLGLWLYLLSGPAMAVVWYSYTSGNWEDPRVWTQDASGKFLKPDGNKAFPVVGDQVVILSGDVIAIPSKYAALSLARMTVQDGATLRIQTDGTVSHNFGELYGRGRIELSSLKRPMGNSTKLNGFDTAEGGTYVLKAAGTISEVWDVNNLEIDLPAATNEVVLLQNLTAVGGVQINKGTLRIGQEGAAPATLGLQLKIASSLFVNQDGRMQVGTGKHNLDLGGDFAIRGAVDLTKNINTTNTAEGSDYVTVRFTSKEVNQELRLEASAEFEQIVVNKGLDANNQLRLVASAPNLFFLRGISSRKVLDRTDGVIYEDESSCLYLKDGVARIGANISIPHYQTGANNAHIPAAAMLWIDGGEVGITENANAIVIYGALKVSAGKLTVDAGNGITLRDDGRLQIDGGEVEAIEFRSSILTSAHIGGFEMNGGKFTLRGGSEVQYATFCLPYAVNSFRMTGGTILIKQQAPALPKGNAPAVPAEGSNPGRPAVIQDPYGGWMVAVDPANIFVSGGTVIMENPTDDEFRLSSTAPFYNLELRRVTGTARAPFVLQDLSYTIGSAYKTTNQPLRVLNDLKLAGYETDIAEGKTPSENRNTLLVAAPTANQADVRDVYVGRNFILEGYSGYQPYYSATGIFPISSSANIPTVRNMTVFDGAQDGAIIVSRAIGLANPFITATTGRIHTPAEIHPSGEGVAGTGGPLNFGSLRVQKSPGKRIRLQDIANGAPALTNIDPFMLGICGSVEVLSGILDQGNYVICLFTGSGTNIVVNERFGTYNTALPAATIRISEAGNGPIALQTANGAVFGSVRFDNSSGTNSEFRMMNNLRIEDLDMWNGKVNMQTYKLTVDNIRRYNSSEDINDITKYGVNRLFYGAGNVSDGGLEMRVTSNTLKLFPVGVLTGGTIKYTPVQVTPSGLAGTGAENAYLCIIPVDKEQPILKQPEKAMSFYWRTIPSNFPTAAKATYQFHAPTAEADGENTSSWRSGNVLGIIPFTRTEVEALGTSSMTNYLQPTFTNVNFELADYTAGQKDAFTGTTAIFRHKAPANSEVEWTNVDQWQIWNGTGFVDQDDPKKFPTPTDVAQLPLSTGYYQVKISDATGRGAAVVNFVDGATGARSRGRIYLKKGTSFQTAQVTGAGCIEYEFTSQADLPTINADADFGDFNEIPDSRISFKHMGSGSVTVARSVYPSVRVEGNDKNRLSADHQPAIIFSGDVKLSGYLRVDMNSMVRVTNATNNISIGKELSLGPDSHGGQMVLEATTPRTISVGGELAIGGVFGQDSRIGTDSKLVGNGVAHKLVVAGDVRLARYGNMQNTGAIILEMSGSAAAKYFVGNNSSTELLNPTGAEIPVIPSFSRLVIDKPQGIAVDLNYDLDLTGPAHGKVEEKQLVLRSGILRMNHTGLDFLLNEDNGTTASAAHFKIPQVAALEVNAGQIRLTNTRAVSGNVIQSNGIQLDGALTIGSFVKTSGVTTVNWQGAALLASGTGDNPILYSSSGSPALTVTAGSLLVGGGIRRDIGSTAGRLKYKQTGGEVLVGVNASHNETRRGVFELLNEGSTFELTGTSKLAIVNAHSGDPLTGIGSFMLSDSVQVNMGTSATLQFGYGDGTGTGVTTNNSAKNRTFYINSIPALTNVKLLGTANLNIGTSTQESAVLRLSGNALRINNQLTIERNATLDARDPREAEGKDVYMAGDWLLNGAYAATGNSKNHTYFVGSTSKLRREQAPATGAIPAVAGVGFHQLTIEPSVVFNLGEGSGANLQAVVEDQLYILGRTNVMTTQPLWVKANIYLKGVVEGSGLLFNNTANSRQQILPLATQLYISAVEVNNPGIIALNTVFGTGESVTLDVSSKFQLTSGVFDVGDNRLVITETLDKITSDNWGGQNFDATRLIFVNGVASSRGLMKRFKAGASNFLYPVGMPGRASATNKYRPVLIDVSANPMAAGAAHVLVRPIDEQHPVTADPVFAQNALRFYWRAESSVLASGFAATMTAQYAQEDVAKDDYYKGKAITCPDQPIEYFYGSAVLRDDALSWAKGDVGNPCFRSATGFVGGVDMTLNQLQVDLGAALRDATGKIAADFTAGDVWGTGDNLSFPGVRTYTTNEPAARWGNTAGKWKVVSEATPGGDNFTGIPPRGVAVVIDAGHTLTLDQNDVLTRTLEIKDRGTLEVINTDGHNLNRVIGKGTIRISSETDVVTFPGGRYDDFMGLTGGIVEYAGSGNYKIPTADHPSIRGLVISGTGSKTLASTQVTGDKGLVMKSGSKLTFNAAVLGTLALENNALRLGTAKQIDIQGPLTLESGSVLDLQGAVLKVSGETQLSGNLKLGAFNAYLNHLTMKTGADMDLGTPAGMSYLNIAGNMTREAGEISFAQCSQAFSRRFVLNGQGSTAQTITGLFTNASNCAICELEMNNLPHARISLQSTGGVTSSKVEVRQKLILTKGVLNAGYDRTSNATGITPYNRADVYSASTPIHNMDTKLILMSTATTSGGSNLSYVRGWIGKHVTGTAQAFTFPVGDMGLYAPVVLSNINNNGETNGRLWRAVYYRKSPQSSFGDRVNKGLLSGTPTSGFHISTSEFWMVGDRDYKDANGPKSGGSADVSLPWTQGLSGEIPNPADLRVMSAIASLGTGVQSGDVNYDWELPSTTVVTTKAVQQPSTGTTKGVVRANGVGFSVKAFTLGSNLKATTAGNVLPVELLSFQAKPLQAQVDLRWELANAHTLDRVEVQRSADGVSFRTEQTVYATGEGRLSQQWTDAQPLAKAYYRLMLLEQDGKYQYSPVQQVSLQASSDAPALLLYPNPTDGSQMPQLRALNLPANAQVLLEVHSMTGQTVWQHRLTTDAAGMIEQVLKAPASLPTGVYILQLVSPQGKLTTRWMKQ